MNEVRIKRVRSLVHKLNKERRKQSLKIDILCNDMVSAHREFVQQISSLNFTVKFYETAIACSDLNALVENTIDMISKNIEGSKVSIFLLNDDSFDVHMSAGDPVDVEQVGLESCLTIDVVKEISRSVHVCTMDDMCRAGLQVSPAISKSTSAAAIPLGFVGEPFGLILISRPVENKLQSSELEGVTAITNALCTAIKSQKSRQKTF